MKLLTISLIMDKTDKTLKWLFSSTSISVFNSCVKLLDIHTSVWAPSLLSSHNMLRFTVSGYLSYIIIFVWFLISFWWNVYCFLPEILAQLEVMKSANNQHEYHSKSQHWLKPTRPAFGNQVTHTSTCCLTC